jgi:hypothetical protein
MFDEDRNTALNRAACIVVITSRMTGPLPDGAWMAATTRVLHRDTRSLYARIQKCANNAIRLMLFAQYAGRKLPDETISLAWERAGNLIVPAEVRRGSGVAEYSGKALPPGPDALQVTTLQFKPHALTRSQPPREGS